MVLGTDMTNHYNFGAQIHLSLNVTIAYCARSTLYCQSAFYAIICAPFERHLNEIKEQTADPTRLDRIQVLTFILHACDICHPVRGSTVSIFSTVW